VNLAVKKGNEFCGKFNFFKENQKTSYAIILSNFLESIIVSSSLARFVSIRFSFKHMFIIDANYVFLKISKKYLVSI
jgi:hypothetical protein